MRNKVLLNEPAKSIRAHCTFNKARSVQSERDWREIPPHVSQSMNRVS